MSEDNHLGGHLAQDNILYVHALINMYLSKFWHCYLLLGQFMKLR
jgi:hypothetical protein